MSKDRLITASKLDRFWLGLTLHHPSCDPGTITAALCIAPFAAMQAGQRVGTVVRKSSVWMARYRDGISNDAFQMALSDVLELLKENDPFLVGFLAGDGEITLSINQYVTWLDGVIFDLQLESTFLASLAEYSVRLQIRAWSAESE